MGDDSFSFSSLYFLIVKIKPHNMTWLSDLGLFYNKEKFFKNGNCVKAKQRKEKLVKAAPEHASLSLTAQ